MSLPKVFQNPNLTTVPGGVLERGSDGKRRLFSRGKCFGIVERTPGHAWRAIPSDNRPIKTCSSMKLAVAHLFNKG